jgi:tRNA(Ile)-lysidine synthase
MDSMVLLHLMSIDYSISVAHVNHKMRGEDSNLDELIVKEYCQAHSIPFYSVVLPDQIKSKGNFQNEARKFRYAYMIRLIKDHDIDAIITAHHKEDNIESVLNNFLKGTGLPGFTGIKKYNRELSALRPLLDVDKGQIIEYAREHNVPYRLDSSNLQNKYRRNKIRNLLLPYLEENIDQNSKAGISLSIDNLNEYNQLLYELIINTITPSSLHNGEILDLNKFQNITYKPLALYYIAHKYGFNLDQCKDLFKMKDIRSIKIENEAYEMIRDRAEIIIREKQKSIDEVLYIEEIGSYKLGDLIIDISAETFSSNPNSIHISSDKPIYPFKIRSRRDGDMFKPSGMSGMKKKVKKFIIDSKFSTLQKDLLCIIEKDSAIIAVAPYRVAHLYDLKSQKYNVHIEIKKDEK